VLLLRRCRAMASERDFRAKAAGVLADLRAVNDEHYYGGEDERQEAMSTALDCAAATLGADLGQQLADALVEEPHTNE
jgi:hypothetical protein